MSPFSQCLVALRTRYGIRQGELAALVGYEQSYISALEVGLKGPPTAELVERICEGLSLSTEEKQRLHEALCASQRKFTIDVDAREDVCWMFRDLREQLSELSEVQVRMIRDLVRLRDPQNRQALKPTRSVTRNRLKEATM